MLLIIVYRYHTQKFHIFASIVLGFLCLHMGVTLQLWHVVLCHVVSEFQSN